MYQIKGEPQQQQLEITTPILATTTMKKYSMKSDKKSRFLNYNERKADLSAPSRPALPPFDPPASLCRPKAKPQPNERYSKYEIQNA